MANSEYCPQDCCYLSLTEKRQNELKNLTGMTSHHFCKKYNVRLYHLLAHPDLYRCEQCLNSNVVGKSSEVDQNAIRKRFICNNILDE